jgi:hypothetical protein
MVLFNIYRNDNCELATDFDMGDLEFVFCDQIVSSRGNSRLLNMIYISISDLINGLLRLKDGGKHYLFVGVDSSFTIRFERKGQGVNIFYKKKYGPFSLRELLQAVNFGIDKFLADPRNMLPVGGPMYDDFNECRRKLEKALAQNHLVKSTRTF